MRAAAAAAVPEATICCSGCSKGATCKHNARQGELSQQQGFGEQELGFQQLRGFLCWSQVSGAVHVVANWWLQRALLLKAALG
jgi:hypothetical protein